MKYTATIDGVKKVVEVTGEGVRMDGAHREAHLEVLSDAPVARISLDGRNENVAFSKDAEGWAVYWKGRVYRIDVVDERTGAIREAAGQGGHHVGGGKIKAPMPGLVLRIEVEEGQVVEAGAGLAVLEAMKMENEIRAPGRAKVGAIKVKEGEAVEKGAVLIELEDAS